MGKCRSVILGCGGRAHAHARVYPQLNDMELVAVCDLIQERVDEYQKQYGVPKGYTDYEEMLEKEKPDVVHVVTLPDNRIWEAETSAKAGVPAIIMEKPMAIKPSEGAGLRRVVEQYGCEIIINQQRRYFPSVRAFQAATAGRLGDVHFVRASVAGNMIAMGPHLMDLLLLFLGEAEPDSVWATAYDICEESYEITHQAPQSMMAQYTFPGNTRVFFDCTPTCLGTPGETGFWMHMSLDFWCSNGRAWYTQNKGWGYQLVGMAEPVTGPSGFVEEDVPGQRDFTQAAGDWVWDHSKTHYNCFAHSIRGFNALMALQQSILLGRPVDCPCDYTDDQWQELRDRLKAANLPDLSPFA